MQDIKTSNNRNIYEEKKNNEEQDRKTIQEETKNTDKSE